MNLLILRHGETAWTISRRYTGTTELQLTTRGQARACAQSDALRALLSDNTPVVLVSPRQRAAQTAALELPTFATETEPLLREYEYGEYEGLTPAQIEVRSPGWNM